MRLLLRLVPLALAMVFAPPVGAVNYTLKNGNSSTLVSDRTGAIVWNIDQGNLDFDEATDNLIMSNYFLRVGSSGKEFNFFNIFGAPVVRNAFANSLTFSFSNASMAATLEWSLVGGVEGSGQSILSKAVSITNLTNNPLDLHLFDYSDYDINFDQYKQADQATLVGPGHIVTTSATVPFQIDAQVSEKPDHYQITDFITPYRQLFIDQDGPTTLSDAPAPGVAYPQTPKDNAFAFQWDRLLQAGHTFSVNQVATYAPSAVPEPASWAMMLIGFGALGTALRRTNKRLQRTGTVPA